MVWTAQLALMTEAIGVLNDGDAAALLRGPLTALSGYAVVIGTLIACMGAVDRYLALVESVLGDYDAADIHFQRALELELRMDAPALIARTQ
jgi:hypothetical protein